MRRIIDIIIFSILLSSCSLEPLYYGDINETMLELDVNWSIQKSLPNGATVFIYTKDAKLYSRLPAFSNPKQIKTTLAPGHYIAVVISNTPSEYTQHSFEDYDDLSSLKAKQVFSKKPIIPVNIPNEVFSYAIFNDVIVDNSTVNYYKSEAKIPHKNLNFKIYIKGLIYAAAPPTVTFKNYHDEFFIGTQKKGASLRDLKFIMNNRTMDPSNSINGHIHRTFSVFDIGSKENKYILKFDFKLKDGQNYTIEKDVSKYIKINGKNINIELSIELPKVKTDDDMPFEPNVDGWNDIEINVHL